MNYFDGFGNSVLDKLKAIASIDIEYGRSNNANYYFY